MANLCQHLDELTISLSSCNEVPSPVVILFVPVRFQSWNLSSCSSWGHPTLPAKKNQLCLCRPFVTAKTMPSNLSSLPKLIPLSSLPPPLFPRVQASHRAHTLFARAFSTFPSLRTTAPRTPPPTPPPPPVRRPARGRGSTTGTGARSTCPSFPPPRRSGRSTCFPRDRGEAGLETEAGS